MIDPFNSEDIPHEVLWEYITEDIDDIQDATGQESVSPSELKVKKNKKSSKKKEINNLEDEDIPL